MEDICNTFEYLSLKTWYDLCDGERFNLRVGEESITDYMLLDIARKHSSSVVAVKFSRHEESRNTGADWDWLFVSSGLIFGLRVQAKKLDVEKYRYSGVTKKSGKSRGFQINKLIRSAAKNKLYPIHPIYCFYNYWGDYPFSGENRCSCILHYPELWGCSIADAKSVRKKMKQNKLGFKDIAPLSIPMPCLFCCSADKETENGKMPLPIRIRNVVKQISGRNHLPECSTDIPGFVYEILERGRNKKNILGLDLEFEAKFSENLLQDISGIIIFTDIQPISR